MVCAAAGECRARILGIKFMQQGRQEVSTENRQNSRKVFNKYQGKTKGLTCISCRPREQPLKLWMHMVNPKALNKASWQFLSTGEVDTDF